MSAVIAALRAELTLDSSKFNAGARQAEGQTSRLQNGFRGLEGAANRSGSALQRLGQSAQGGSGGFQNLSYQMQDFAVQVGSGTSAMQALGQQLPQLLSGFGAVGAALGLVAAVSIPVVRYFMAAGDSAEDAAKGAEAFGAALSAFEGYAATAGTSIRDLREEFGGFAGEVKAEAIEMMRFSAAALSQSAAGAASPIRAQLADVSEAYDEYIAALKGYAQEAATFGRSALQEAQLKQMEAAFEEVAEAAGLSGDEFVALQAAMRGLANSAGQDLGTVLGRLVNLRDTLRETFQGQDVPEIAAMVDDLTAEINTLRSVLAQSGVEAEEMGTSLETAGDDARALLPPLEEMSAEASKFAEFLADAHEWSQKIGAETRANRDAYREYQSSRATGQNLGLSGEAGALLDRIIGVESGGDPSARNPNSSATGLGQFIESTWLALFRQHFPDELARIGPDAALALREDAAFSRQMVALYIEENRKMLAQAGVAITDANLYLAHFLGPGGAIALNRNPGAAVVDTLGRDQIAANPSILGGGQTGADVIAWAQAKVGVGVPALEAMEAAAAAEAAALKESTQAAEEAQRSLDSLTASLDPAAKASIDLANMQAKVDAAVKGGAISAAQGAQMMADFQAALDTRTAEEQAEKLADVQGALDGIVGSLDPATQASLEFAEAQKAVAAAVDAGIISAARGQQILDDLTMQQIMDTAEMQDLIAAQEDAAAEVQGIWDGATESMADYFADGIMGGFEDGIEGAIDILKDGLRQMITIALRNRIFIPIQTGIQAALGGGALPGMGPGSGLLGGIGSAIGGAMSGFLGGAGSVLGGLFSGGLGGAAGAIGTALSGATAGLAGFATALGAIAVPVAAVVAIFSLFRKKTEVLDQGLRITLDGMDALVETFTRTRTTRLFGLIRNTSTDYDPASADVADPITDAYRDVYNSVSGMAENLGLSADALEDFSYDFKLSLEGLTDEQKGAALQAEFEKIADALARTAGVTGRYIRVGESASQALERLTNDLAAANGAMAALGFDLYDVSIQGAHAASSFVKLFGSLDQFASAMEFYHTNFYSLAERAQEAGRQFQSGLQDIGLNVVPQTEEAFRALVDRLMANGRQNAAAQLIQLAPLFQQMLALREEAAGPREDTPSNVVSLADRLEEARRAAQGVDVDRFSTRLAYERAQAREAQRVLTPRLSEDGRQIVVGIEAVRREQARMRDELKQLGEQTVTNTRHTARLLREQNAVGLPARQA